jgi:hypothetical protein
MSRRHEPFASSAPFTRRLVLFLAAAGILAPLARIWVPVGKSNSHVDQIVALLAPLRTESAAAIGQIVVAEHPEMADSRYVQARLLADLKLDGQGILLVSRAEMARLIANRVRDDFAGEQVVNVAGWRFALTEARLCALAAQHAD